MELVIDEGAIDGLVARTELRPRFPFLGQMVWRRGCCGQPKLQMPNYEAIKANLVFMSKEKKDEFKAAMHASKVTVFYRASGGVQEHSF